MYSKEELLNGLTTDVIGKKLFVFESIDSTNACAKTLAEAGMEEGALVVADFQSQGRGRFARSWLSEAGKNLLFSCVLRPPLSQDQVGLLTFYAAVAVARPLEHATGLAVECKWPNDLLLNGKKCCGILLENSLSQEQLVYAILGIGINVNQQAFEGDLQDTATSLARETGKEIDRKKLFHAIVTELDNLYHDVASRQFHRIVSEWNKRCAMFGQRVRIARNKEAITGKALGLSPDGGLIVETTRGREVVYAGDVTIAVS
jgi:BirA family biotin operon repressor/biotin-[acetyl-CoA-carboxylase] ligase